MRRPSPFTERRSEIDIKMTPMIDVVFLLLVYLARRRISGARLVGSCGWCVSAPLHMVVGARFIDS